MLPIYICDDNKELLDKIYRHIRTYMQFKFENIEPCIQAYSDVYEFQKCINKIDSTGVYFLDIDFKQDITGLDLAYEIRAKDPLGFIIFVTTYEKYLPETFSRKLAAMDFIVKDNGDLLKQINSALNTVFSRYRLMLDKTNIFAETLVLNLRNVTEIFEQHQIMYIKTVPKKHNVIIYHVSGNAKVPFTLTEIFNKLDKRFFIMCNRSEIVNLLHIKKIDNKKKEIILKNDVVISISRRYFNEMLKIIKNRAL